MIRAGQNTFNEDQLGLLARPGHINATVLFSVSLTQRKSGLVQNPLTVNINIYPLSIKLAELIR